MPKKFSLFMDPLISRTLKYIQIYGCRQKFACVFLYFLQDKYKMYFCTKMYLYQKWIIIMFFYQLLNEHLEKMSETSCEVPVYNVLYNEQSDEYIVLAEGCIGVCIFIHCLFFPCFTFLHVQNLIILLDKKLPFHEMFIPESEILRFLIQFGPFISLWNKVVATSIWQSLCDANKKLSSGNNGCGRKYSMWVVLPRNKRASIFAATIPRPVERVPSRFKLLC